jgi:hypothetical protein
MSNTWTGNPLKLDTAEDNAFSGLVKRWEWHPNAANNDINVEDTATNTLFKCRAPIGAPNDEAEGIISVQEIPPRLVTGIHLVTIDGGTLYVHLHRTRERS